MDDIIPDISGCKGFIPKDAMNKIKININSNNKKDNNKFARNGKFTLDEFMEKLKAQGDKCYICLQGFKYDGGKWCYYFPSSDRINNNYPHDKDNIAISCLYCNIRYYKEHHLNTKINKNCGLCEGLNHIYEDNIITKSQLFRNLGNSNYRIKEYIYDINKTPEELAAKKEAKIKIFDSDYYSD